MKHGWIGFGLMFFLVFGLSGCGGGTVTPAPMEVDTSNQSRIVGGTQYSGLPAVGALTYNGRAHCTATLVEPRKILTAGHCVSGFNAKRMRFVIGPSVSSPQHVIKVVSAKAYPSFSSYSLTNDIAYAVLAEDAPVPPMSILPAMDSSFRGEDLFFVGYGVDNGYTQSGIGVKRAAWITLNRVDSTTFRYSDPYKNTCGGDSGGPAFWQNSNGDYLIAGVTSYGDWYCTEFGVDTRVDVYAHFLNIETTPVDPPDDPPTGGGCGDETYAGRCDNNQVVWCENDEIYTSNCTAKNLECGWSDADQYYACVQPTDPCHGETFDGRCDGNTVIWCENNQVNSLDCNRCGWDAQAGFYNCL